MYDQMVSKMYTSGASMVWNGNPSVGQSDIDAFLNRLPPSEHEIKSLDAQTVPGESNAAIEERILILFYPV